MPLECASEATNNFQDPHPREKKKTKELWCTNSTTHKVYGRKKKIHFMLQTYI
jgi:hypothetical protein